MLLRPDIERRAGDFVHERHCKAEPAAIDGLEIAAAGLARVHAHMLERGRLKISELALVFFTARGTEDAAERPRCQAGRTQQLAASPLERIRRGSVEDRKLGRAATAWTTLA